MTNDYIHGDVFGTWDQIKTHPIVNIYKDFEKLNFQDTFFALNIQQLNPTRIPVDRFKKIVISYHTEYFQHSLLWDFFNRNKQCKFLFLCDTIAVNIWPDNVECHQWITWGQQLDVAIRHHGIIDTASIPKYKLSSLSNRHEFHKAAITAFLLEHLNRDDMVISWNNWCPDSLYYQTDDFYIPPEIKKYLQGKFQNIDQIILDTFKNTPILNGNWKHPAYLDCAINITNESIFNTNAQLNGKEVVLPTPYLTEKTWKPLLAGRPFIPVGQLETLASLQHLGLVFDYGLDLSFDTCVQDFDRVLLLYKCLTQLFEMSAVDIYNSTLSSTQHNLEYIRSGKFKAQCNQINNQSLERIEQW